MAMLHSFAAAARHGSFTRAGAEVGLSQSAISRQIANLEAWLGLPLFDRLGRRIRLNAAGEAYARAVVPGLDLIRQGTGALLDASLLDRKVELACLPSFATRWLAPRLPALQKALPDLVLNVASRSDEFDFAGEPFDAAIHYGLPNWPRVEHRLLFRERTIPVVSGALAAGGGLDTPAALLRLPLLVHSWRLDAWQRWAALCGVDLAPRPLPSFANFLTLAEAVIAGAGAALIPAFLIERELASGVLVCPVDRPLVDDKAYYCVYPADRLRRPSFKAFLDWITAQSG
jgi:LysR family transcriptional regulator, glycine cleavage system transcriptional activator